MTGAPDDLGCPYCESVDAELPRDHAETYARLTGLTVPRVHALLDGARLTAADVATALWSGSVEPRAAEDLKGGQLVELVSRHCASLGHCRCPHRPTSSGRESREPPARAEGQVRPCSTSSGRCEIPHDPHAT